MADTLLQKFEAICDEIFDHWDKGMKSGKLLTALAGRLSFYRADVTEVREGLRIAPPFIPTHRHVKRGSSYQLIGLGSLQTATPCHETAVLAIYRDATGKYWLRPHDEFNDGRFEEVSNG